MKESSKDKTEAQGFMEFLPFDSPLKKPRPEFPVSCLPPALGGIASAISESIQVSVDMPAVAELAVVALCVSNRFVISPKEDWTEPLNLFVLTIARPSERKSPVLKVVTQPIEDFVLRYNEDNRENRLHYEAQLSVAESRLAAAKNQARNIRKSDKNEIMTASESSDMVAYYSEELEKMKANPVRLLRLLADDVTQEALTGLLTEAGRLGIISSEGGVFDIIAGKYSNGIVSTDIYTKGYSGDSIRVDRRGRAPEEILHPALTMLLTIQPSVLDEIMSNNAFAGRGLLARFLYSIPASRVGTRRFRTKPIPEHVKASYNDLLRRLLRVPDTDTPGVIQLDLPAELAAEEYAERLEVRLNDDLITVEDWAGKFHGQIMRIAGCLHCCLYGEKAAEHLLSLETMEQAECIGEYFLAHAQAAYRAMSLTDTPAVREGRYLLRRMDEKQITKRELFKRCDGHYSRVEDMQEGLNELITRGYIRIDSLRTGGRPSEMIVLNPEYLRTKPPKGTKA